MSRGKRPPHFGLAPVGDYRRCWCCGHGFISMKCLLHGFHLGADRETNNCKDYSEEGMDLPHWIKGCKDVEKYKKGFGVQ